MGSKKGDVCLGCFPWGRRRESSPPRSRAKTRPVSAIKPSVGASGNKVRGIIKGAPEPPPLQWRSQVGASDTSSTASVRHGTSDSGAANMYISATAFMDTDTRPLSSPGARASTGPKQGRLANQPQQHHLSATSASTTSAGAADDYAADGAFQDPVDAARIREQNRLDPAARLQELQERHRLRSRGGGDGGGTRPRSSVADERLRNDQIQCDSFSYNASVHARHSSTGTHAHLGPLPPLLVSPGGALLAGGSAGLGPDPRKSDMGSPAKKPLPLMHSPLHSRTNSLTAPIPGSLPSMTQPARSPQRSPSSALACGVGPPSPVVAGSGSGVGSTGLDSPGRHGRYAQQQLRSREHAEQQVGLEPGASAQGGGGAGGRNQGSGDGLEEGFSFTARWQPGVRPSGGVRASRDMAPPAARESNRISGSGTGAAYPLAHHTPHGPAGYSSSSVTAPPAFAARQFAQLPSGHLSGPDRSSPSVGLVSEGMGGPERDRHLGRNSSSGLGKGGGGASERPAAGSPRAFAPEPLEEVRQPHLAAPGLGDYAAGALATPPSFGAAAEPRALQHQPSQQQQQQQQRYLPTESPDEGYLQQQLNQLQQQQLQQLQEQQPQLQAAFQRVQSRDARGADPDQRSLEQQTSVSRVRSGKAGSEPIVAAAGGPKQDYRPMTSVSQRKEAAMANEEMLASLLAGTRAFDFASTKVGAGAADELERFDRVQDAMSRLDDILAAPPLAPARSLNARSGATENAVSDFAGATPLHNPFMGVKRW